MRDNMHTSHLSDANKQDTIMQRNPLLLQHHQGRQSFGLLQKATGERSGDNLLQQCIGSTVLVRPWRRALKKF